MTEQTPAETPQTVNVQIGIGAQYIKDFSFESPNAPLIFNEMVAPPQVALDINVMSKKVDASAYETILKIKMEAKVNNKVAFIAELAYSGIFVLPEMPDEQNKLFLLVEAPRLLFPFARAIISNAVREGGFPNISLQPIDFYSLYMSEKDRVGMMTPQGEA